MGRNENLQIEADPQELEQVLMNLIDNVAQSARQIDRPEVMVRMDTDVEEFCYHAQDNGNKVSEEVREKMFDPFYTTKLTGEGTGLGLSIVSGIVDRLDGSISYQ